MKISIAILFGGESSEHKISLKSSINVIEAIDKNKYHLILIGVEKDGTLGIRSHKKYILYPNDINRIQLGPPIAYLAVIPGKFKFKFLNLRDKKTFKVDLIFSVLHGEKGENGSFQGLCNTLNIPYVGSGVLGSSSLPRIGAIDIPPEHFPSFKDIIQFSYDHEKMIKWYVSEQYEEEKMFKSILDRMDLINSDINGLYFIDQSLKDIRKV
uniref:Dala_Dala_lig_N domain-containing protein n=1 Tax=Glossina pallidipes TaxID=7398 RepID=A0A1A9Z151_GLOPL